jgi:hypothetical protein
MLYLKEDDAEIMGVFGFLVDFEFLNNFYCIKRILKVEG